MENIKLSWELYKTLLGENRIYKLTILGFTLVNLLLAPLEIVFGQKVLNTFDILWGGKIDWVLGLGSLAVAMFAEAFLMVMVAYMSKSLLENKRPLIFKEKKRLWYMVRETVLFATLLNIIFLLSYFMPLMYGTPRTPLLTLFGVLSALLIFTPQAIVIEDRKYPFAAAKSISFCHKRPLSFLKVLGAGLVLFALNGYIFTMLEGVIGGISSHLSLIVTSALVIPLLTTYATVTYLKRYTLFIPERHGQKRRHI